MTKKSIFGYWQKLIIVLTALSFIISVWFDYNTYWSVPHIYFPDTGSQWEFPMIVIGDLVWSVLRGFALFIISLAIPITSPYSKNQMTLAFWQNK